MYNLEDTRKVFKFGENTTAVSLPKELGVKIGSRVAFEKIDENSFKVIMVDIKVQPTENVIKETKEEKHD